MLLFLQCSEYVLIAVYTKAKPYAISDFSNWIDRIEVEISSKKELTVSGCRIMEIDINAFAW